MTFQPGQVSNPNGRKPGSRNRRTQEILDLIKDNKDPLVALSEIISTSENPEHRISASNILAPYLHSKRGMVQAPRFVEGAISVPEFTSIQDAQNFLADIAGRSGAGELELQSALDISTLVKNWILSVTAQDELQLKIAKENPQGPQEIHIVGGLPDLPGTSIIMDETAVGRVNGHNGKVINHQNDSVNGTNVSSALANSDKPPANKLETNANTSSDT